MYLFFKHLGAIELCTYIKRSQYRIHINWPLSQQPVTLMLGFLFQESKNELRERTRQEIYSVYSDTERESERESELYSG